MSTARSRPPAAERLEAIIAAATRAFRVRGFEQTAMAGIAAEVGVAEGTLYRYFDSKRALLHAVLERWYQDLFAATDAALAGVTGIRPRLRLLIWRHLTTLHDEPELCRLMFTETRQGPADTAVLDDLNRRYSSALIELIARGQAAGELRDDLSPGLVRDLVFGGIEHRFWGLRHSSRPLDIDATADALTEIIWHGIALPTQDTVQQELARLTAAVDRIQSHRKTSA